jgi:predicted nucleic acid-binding protein
MTGIALDTNVVPEARQAKPEPRVQAWLARQDPSALYLTATVIRELASASCPCPLAPGGTV